MPAAVAGGLAEEGASSGLSDLRLISGLGSGSATAPSPPSSCTHNTESKWRRETSGKGE